MYCSRIQIAATSVQVLSIYNVECTRFRTFRW